MQHWSQYNLPQLCLKALTLHKHHGIVLVSQCHFDLLKIWPDMTWVWVLLRKVPIKIATDIYRDRRYIITCALVSFSDSTSVNISPERYQKTPYTLTRMFDEGLTDEPYTLVLLNVLIIRIHGDIVLSKFTTRLIKNKPHILRPPKKIIQ